MKLRINEDAEDWFVIDDNDSYYSWENKSDISKYVEFYNKKYKDWNYTVFKMINNELSEHSTAFKDDVLRYMYELKAQAKTQAKADPYDLALKYFDMSLDDKEINDILTKQGYSWEFIQQVIDYIDNFYEDSKQYNESIVNKLRGKNYFNINPILQEYLDFLEEAGIEVLNVYFGTKSIEVRNKDLEDASFYLCDRDYFGKDLYRQGWSVVSNI